MFLPFLLRHQRENIMCQYPYDSLKIIICLLWHHDCQTGTQLKYCILIETPFILNFSIELKEKDMAEIIVPSNIDTCLTMDLILILTTCQFLDNYLSVSMRENFWLLIFSSFDSNTFVTFARWVSSKANGLLNVTKYPGTISLRLLVRAPTATFTVTCQKPWIYIHKSRAGRQPFTRRFLAPLNGEFNAPRKRKKWRY